MLFAIALRLPMVFKFTSLVNIHLLLQIEACPNAEVDILHWGKLQSYTVVGHLLGLGAGLLAVTLLGGRDAPAVLSTNQLTPVRVWAAVIAIALNMLGGLLLRASHPPAAATTLLVALGGFKPTVHDALTVIISVLIVATIGEGLRRIRLGKMSSSFD